jgi:phospholipid:diacylglycerol acyltransferase
MSALRRRIARVFSETSSPSPGDSRESTPEEVKLGPVSKLKDLTKRKKSKRKSGLLFGLGGLVGIVVALFFAQQNDVIKFEGMLDVNLDSFLDVIPASVIKDARDLTVCTGLLLSEEFPYAK